MYKIGVALLISLSLGGAAFGEGDAKKGKRVFKKCKACHSVKEGDAKTGPSLFKVVGSAAGSMEGFSYSKAMMESGLTWDIETLSAFLADPKGTVPRNKMSFAGLKKQSDIDNVIAYILEESE